MMRWWWFGPDVDRAELARELRTMKAGGIGGVEIQPVYPLALDDPQEGIRNMKFLSPEFLSMVSFANATAHELGLRVSITLGSGWPYGGPSVAATEAASHLRVVSDNPPQGQDSVLIPALENGEKLLAAFVVAINDRSEWNAHHARPVEDFTNGRVKVSPGQRALFFISSPTGQQVKRAANGAEGFVLDPFSASGVQDYLKNVAEPLVRAFGDHPPYSVFSDSLEVYGSNWTPGFLEQFRNRRGYDLTPYLPEFNLGGGPELPNLEYDWHRTLAELIDRNYLTAINNWARAHHTQFRSQSYGIPAVTLSSNALVDLPEGEGSQWHGPFSYTRWATSASHVYGRPVTSSETWTWLHSPAFRATPLDMKAEADIFFLQGINQLVGHGWPYSPPSAGEPGYSFYAAAVFNNHNPWWIVMPEITNYLTRMSWLLRQGKPANDVAVLLPEEDAQSREYHHGGEGGATVSDQMPQLLGPDLVPAILNAGFNFDFIDSAAIDRVGIHYPVLVLPGIERIPLATYKKIEDFARSGGVVIATQSVPTGAPGFLESPSDTPAVRQISQELFTPDARNAKLVKKTSDLGAALSSFLQPDVTLAPGAAEVGFIHRRLPDADLYFIANTGNRPHALTATFRTTYRNGEFWDPFTGKMSTASDGPILKITLAPYESRVLVFSDHPLPETATAAATNFPPIDLSHDWHVTLDKTGAALAMETLHSWSDEEPGRHYSGTATYTKTVDIPDEVARAGSALLDFGEGKPVRPTKLNQSGMQTWLDAPVHDAALVYLNGKLAGSVWHPPFTLDIGKALRPGPNQLKIVVANTAINELAGRAPADYTLLWLRYGQRFTPQDMDHLQPLPSGILGPLRIVPATLPDAQSR